MGVARNFEDALFMVKWNREFESKRNISFGGSKRGGELVWVFQSIRKMCKF